MNKLIKLSDTHYIVVDDSIDFTEKDWYYDNMQKSIRIGSNNHITGGYKQKITHSTQPLEFEYDRGVKDKFFDKIKLLSLLEIEEAIHGYSVEKIKKEYNQGNNKDVFTKGIEQGIEIGFKAHQELVKDKFILTKDQLFKIIAMSKIAKTHDGLIDMDAWISNGYEGATPAYTEEEIIESLLPKTEWNIEFDEQGKIRLL